MLPDPGSSSRKFVGNFLRSRPVDFTITEEPAKGILQRGHENRSLACKSAEERTSGAKM